MKASDAIIGPRQSDDLRLDPELSRYLVLTTKQVEQLALLDEAAKAMRERKARERHLRQHLIGGTVTAVIVVVLVIVAVVWVVR